MLRGEISNKPSPIIAIDYKILAKEEKGKIILKEGAIGWLERNWGFRFIVMIVECFDADKYEFLLSDYVAEVKKFDIGFDLWLWLKQNPQIYKFFTNDTMLYRPMSSICFKHSGWNQRI